MLLTCRSILPYEQTKKYVDNDHHSGSVGNLTTLFQFERLHIDNDIELGLSVRQLAAVIYCKVVMGNLLTFCGLGLETWRLLRICCVVVIKTESRATVRHAHICEGEVQIKLFVCRIITPMKTYEGVELHLHAFLTWASNK